jgi:hypothetical protein
MAWGMQIAVHIPAQESMLLEMNYFLRKSFLGDMVERMYH